MKVISLLNHQNKLLNIIISIASIFIIGILDYWTGYEATFSLFYIIPVSFTTWSIGLKSGSFAALLSTVVLCWADVAAGHVYSSIYIMIWNVLIELSFFIIIIILLSNLKKSMNHEAELARTDNLTGAVNSRFFYDLIEIEIDRFRRYKTVFSLVYIDLDNFKTINDLHGHTTGDQVLQTVVSYIKNHLRKSDIVARLGGDEFALLLPETNLEVVQTICSKIREGLLESMQKNKWPITFSIGVLTCENVPQTPNVLIGMADELMYSVKRRNKNGIEYSVYRN